MLLGRREYGYAAQRMALTSLTTAEIQNNLIVELRSCLFEGARGESFNGQAGSHRLLQRNPTVSRWNYAPGVLAE
jgi:hypothetical protein